MTVRNLLILLSSILLCACSPHTMYSHFEPVPMNGWSADSVLQFEVPVDDTVGLYDVVLCIRHTEAYPYQNMWLFTELDQRIDTIEFYLADDRGRWLGNACSKLIEMPVLFEQAYRFGSVGTHTIRVQQGMRDEALRGVSDVGLIIRKHGEE